METGLPTHGWSTEGRKNPQHSFPDAPNATTPSERTAKGEEEKIVNVGWVSLSKSGKSLTIRVLNQLFFVSLRDLDPVLQRYRNRADVKQWLEQRKEEWEELDIAGLMQQLTS